MSETMSCRRCTVCDGLTHHWLCAPEDADPPTYGYGCKHCPVVGNECETCDGGDDADAECPTCHGEGVVPCGVRLYCDTCGDPPSAEYEVVTLACGHVQCTFCCKDGCTQCVDDDPDDETCAL
jgi:hypothetical protein